MPYCAVYRCSSCYRKKGNITFHSFPKNEETRRRWIQLCGRQDFINADNAVICSLHFEETAFQRNLKYELLGVTVPKNLVRIKEGSVPTLLLPSTQGEHVSSSREVRARRRGQKRLVEEILGQTEEPVEEERTTQEQGLTSRLEELQRQLEDMKKEKDTEKAEWEKEKMEEGDDTDNAAGDNFGRCGMSQESMGCPAVPQIDQDSDIFIGERIHGDMHDSSALSQDIDEKLHIRRDTDGYPEKYQKTHTSKKPHKCPVCEKAFTYRSVVKQHMTVHTGARPHLCSICGTGFSHSSALSKHVKRHTGLKPHKCLVCEKGFYHSYELRAHMTTHTGEKSHRCSLCDSAFSRASDLKVHMRTHTGEKPYKCQLCLVAFSQAGHLKTHIMTHSGEKPYKCSHCDAAFTSAGVLKTHLRTHTGEKPHKCSHCTATFARMDHLRYHINTHTGEMPYKCQECNSAYTRPTALRVHMKVHTRNKSHKCSFCTATFNFLYHLKAHLKSHADEMSHGSDDTSLCDSPESDLKVLKGKKPHECTLCDAGFTRPLALKHHLLIHNHRPQNTDQQKHQIEEIQKEQGLTALEDSMSVDFPKTESNNEPRPLIEVPIKVENDHHASHNLVSAGGSESELRLPIEEVLIKVEDGHVASADLISNSEVPYLQHNKVKVKEEVVDHDWTHSAVFSS